MRYNGYCRETAVAVRRRRRGESCRSFSCISPWFIFSRLFNGYKSKVSRNKEERNWEQEKMDRVSDIRRKSGVVKGSILNHEASSSFSAADDSADISKEAFFNLGVGFGLLYLAAASRNELNRMVDLHRKFELLLQNFNTELLNQEKEQHILPSGSSFASCSSNRVHETLYAEENDSGRKSPETGFISERYRREKSLRMDQLEAELEAEFDRLQLQMDEEFCFKYSDEPHMDMEVTVEDSAPEESQSTIFEEVIEQAESSNNEYYSVPPTELERRLHELLESRQQERINELESALACAMHQLHEKERELSWWKDTARLVSQHLPAIPSLLMRHVDAPIHGNETRILSLEYEKSLV